MQRLRSSRARRVPVDVTTRGGSPGRRGGPRTAMALRGRSRASLFTREVASRGRTLGASLGRDEGRPSVERGGVDSRPPGVRYGRPRSRCLVQGSTSCEIWSETGRRRGEARSFHAARSRARRGASGIEPECGARGSNSPGPARRAGAVTRRRAPPRSTVPPAGVEPATASFGRSRLGVRQDEGDRAYARVSPPGIEPGRPAS